MTLRGGLQLRTGFAVSPAIPRCTRPGFRPAKHTRISARSSSSLVCGATLAHLFTHSKRSASSGSVVDDRVENRSSETSAHDPSRPDFTLFEPVEICEKDELSSQQIQTSSVVVTSAAMCERLAFLIETDAAAAEGLKCEILKNHIELPAHQTITRHCFNLLLRENNIQGYLEWLDIIPDSALQREASQIQNVFHIHLRQIIHLSPRTLGIIQDWLNKMLVKGCLTEGLIRTIVGHLVRSQSPETVVKFHHDVLNLILDRSTLLKNHDKLLLSSLCGQLNHLTILQLANQRHLTQALELFFKSDQESNSFTKFIPLSTYRVLADQLLKIVSQQTDNPSLWTDLLEQVLSSWRLSHPRSLEQWSSSSQDNFPKLPPRDTMSHKSTELRYYRSKLDDPSNDPEDTVHRLVLYLRTVFSQGTHANFIRSAPIADDISQLIPSGDLGSILKQVGYSENKQDEEQYLRALVFDQSTLLKFVREVKAMEKVLTFEQELLSSRCIRFQGDVRLIWAHTWMIFYQRNQLYSKVLDVFLKHFVPVGVDREVILKFRNTTTKYSAIDSRSTPQQQQQQQPNPDSILDSLPLFVPTTGVLNVLYDSILRLAPVESISTIFTSFVQQNLPNSSLSSTLSEEQVVNLPLKISPTTASFRPFVRAFLRIGDIDQALRLMMKVQHLRLETGVFRNEKPDGGDDEGLWIDILEYCASQSAGMHPPSHLIRGLSGQLENAKNFCWGTHRKLKHLGWCGEMKERLVYSTLDRILELSSLVHKPRVSVSEDLIIDDDKNLSSRVVDPRTFLRPNLYSHHLPFINRTLNEVFNKEQLLHPSKLYPLLGTGDNDAYRAFPSLKLLRRVHSGFVSCGNKKGMKTIRRLLEWKKGRQMNPDWYQ